MDPKLSNINPPRKQISSFPSYKWLVWWWLLYLFFFLFFFFPPLNREVLDLERCWARHRGSTRNTESVFSLLKLSRHACTWSNIHNSKNKQAVFCISEHIFKIINKFVWTWTCWVHFINLKVGLWIGVQSFGWSCFAGQQALVGLSWIFLDRNKSHFIKFLNSIIMSYADW